VDYLRHRAKWSAARRESVRSNCDHWFKGAIEDGSLRALSRLLSQTRKREKLVKMVQDAGGLPWAAGQYIVLHCASVGIDAQPHVMDVWPKKGII